MEIFGGCPPPRKYNRSPLDIGYTSQARHTTHTRPRRAAKAQVYLGAGRSSRLTPSAPGGRKRVQGARVLAGRGQSPGGSAETQLIPPRGVPGCKPPAAAARHGQRRRPLSHARAPARACARQTTGRRRILPSTKNRQSTPRTDPDADLIRSDRRRIRHAGRRSTKKK